MTVCLDGFHRYFESYVFNTFIFPFRNRDGLRPFAAELFLQSYHFILKLKFSSLCYTFLRCNDFYIYVHVVSTDVLKRGADMM